MEQGKDSARIVKVEWALLQGERPRSAGCNARLGEHGKVVRVPVARITTDDGLQGFGYCSADEGQARALVGRRLQELYAIDSATNSMRQPFDFPLWDLTGKQAGEPVYRLTARYGNQPLTEPFQVRCYDTSLYFDDLHLADREQAAELIADEAREGYARGHRSFKIKVGRGARHMPVEEGTERDIAVIKAVRAAVGPQCTIMIDANNGFTLNLAKRVLAATAACDVFWIEEAFHEDRTLYSDLKEWLRSQGLATLIADGEGQASPTLLDWAKEGLIDVVQYDIFSYGFTPWLVLAHASLDEWGTRSAPHHYGRYYGNYAACHLAAAIRNFAFVEWDEADVPALRGNDYRIENGFVQVPDRPGFGMELDEELFSQAVAADGYVVS
jgi:L-rhamnonate dehydratase